MSVKPHDVCSVASLTLILLTMWSWVACSEPPLKNYPKKRAPAAAQKGCRP